MRVAAIIIGFGWLGFWLYWIISAFGAKMGTHSDPKQFFGIRLVTVPLAILSVLAIKHLPTSVKDHYQAANNNHLVLAVGLIIFWLGLFTAVWARVNLGKNWGMPMARKQHAELVTTGPYQYIRHPIYTGILLMALGSFLDVNMYWLVVFIDAGVFFVYSAVVEERLMLQQFPKTYLSYKAKTKMLIPFIF